METKDKTAVMYARVASDTQTKSGSSIDTQLSKCREFIKKHGLKELKVFTDSCVSGIDPKPPKLLALVQYVKENPTDYVIVYRIDRLTRSTSMYFRLQATLAELGTDIVSVTEDNGLVETAASRFKRNIRESLRQFHSELQSERTKRAVQKDKSIA